MRNIQRKWAIVLAFFLCAHLGCEARSYNSPVAVVHSDQAVEHECAVDSADAQLFQKVMNRLIKVDLFVREYPSKFIYPPKAFIKPKSQKEVNAYASASKFHGAELDEKTGKILPVVMVTEGMLQQVIKGDENSLAVIMGHELAHLTKDHVGGKRQGKTDVLILSFERDQEIEADLDGIRYAIAAGYPYRAGVAKAYREMRTNTKYSSFEGLSVTHPSWEERLIFLDREQSKLWSAMSAFQNGFFFLEMEQYPAAQQCFKAVIGEFPDCYEAWSNLGYARLMQYCDGLDSDDLKHYGIGQIVTGGFYSRPESLESKVRGTDEKLWKDAVSALNKALTLKSDLVLPQSALGVAYLVHPEGKDLKKAKKWFREALDHLKQDAELKKNPISLAALLINAGVADMAAGDTKEASDKFKAAEKVALSLKLTLSVKTMEEALLYNQAILLALSPDAEAKRRACQMLEDYLAETSADTVWWPLAYLRLAKQAKELDLKIPTRAALVRQSAPPVMRVTTSISVGKEAITLSEPIREAVERLGKDEGDSMPLFAGSKIIRWRFAERGIDLLAKDKILAIFLTNAKSPSVLVRKAGVGGESSAVKVGMSEKAVKYLLKDQRMDRALRFIADDNVGYHFYPELGLGIRFADERVAELAIAQIPRRSFDR